MKNFNQRINENPSILPSGFTGFIIKNSNVVIDKSFIEKGTSFINAYENSNVVLKDCGTPIPTEASAAKVSTAMASKLKEELDRITLPPWVNYNIKRYDNYNKDGNETYVVIPSNANCHLVEVQSMFNVKNNPTYEIVTKYRENLHAAIGTDEEADKDTAPSKMSIQNQIVKGGEISTKDVDYTISGTYYLTNIDSAIKAVWPLDENFGIDQDNPALNLHFKERMTMPISEWKMSDVNKTDLFGNIIYDRNKKEKMLDEDDPDNNHKGSYKYYARSVKNQPYKLSEEYRLSGTQFRMFGMLQNKDGEYFIVGPYTDDTVLYQIRLADNIYEDQHTEPLDFYFKFLNQNISLRDVINTDLTNTAEIKNTSLKNLEPENIKILKDSFLSGINYNRNRIQLDIISGVDQTITPNQQERILNFLGFKNGTLSASSQENEPRITFMTADGPVIDEYLGDAKTQLTDGFFDIKDANFLRVRDPEFENYYVLTSRMTNADAGVEDSYSVPSSSIKFDMTIQSALYDNSPIVSTYIITEFTSGNVKNDETHHWLKSSYEFVLSANNDKNITISDNNKIYNFDVTTINNDTYYTLKCGSTNYYFYPVIAAGNITTNKIYKISKTSSTDIIPQLSSLASLLNNYTSKNEIKIENSVDTFSYQYNENTSKYELKFINENGYNETLNSIIDEKVPELKSNKNFQHHLINLTINWNNRNVYYDDNYDIPLSGYYLILNDNYYTLGNGMTNDLDYLRDGKSYLIQGTELVISSNYFRALNKVIPFDKKDITDFYVRSERYYSKYISYFK